MVHDVLGLTGILIGIDSQNPGPGESAVAAAVTDLVARPAGFTVARHEFEAGRPNLLLTVDKGPGPHLVLSGHMDTKPVGDARDAWRTDPLQMTVVDGLAYGLGASDMKGPIAAMLVALGRFAEEPGSGRASVLLTADEETSSAAGAIALAERGIPACDAVVIGEPSGVSVPWEMIAVVSRGICCVEIEITSRQGHSGLSRTLGRSAVQLAAEVLLAFDAYTPPIAQPGPVPCAPTVNPGMIVQGGVAYGTWPGTCMLGCEIRLVPGMDRQAVLASLEQLAREVVADRGQVLVRSVPDGRAWAPAVAVDPSTRIVRAAQAACAEVLGTAPPLGAYPGTTEASHLMPGLGVPVIASLGPGWLSVAHSPNECVGVEDLSTAAALYTRLLELFAAPDDGSSART